MVGDVDPEVGVGVLEPRAADVGVLLEHRVRDARLLETNRRTQTAETRTDDRDAESLQRGRSAGRVSTRTADGRDPSKFASSSTSGT